MGVEPSKYHGYAFDGVWVIAKAVDQILRKWNAQGVSGPLERDVFRGDRISAALKDTIVMVSA